MHFALFRVGAVLLFGGLLALVLGQSDPVEKTARGILEAKCLSCHGDLRTSDLDLRELGTILKGGKRGPSIVPGKCRPERQVFFPPRSAAALNEKVPHSYIFFSDL